MTRLKEKYRKEAVPSLVKEFSYSNVMQAPKLVKIVVSMGVGAAVTDSKALDGAVKDMSLITGQRPIVTRASKSISNFKIREGMRIGCKVTLRGAMMEEFFDRFVNAVLPRIRDFGGINPDAFDGHGNFSMGLREQLVFPEIEYDKIDRTRGMNIAIATTANTDEEGRALLKALGMPFRKA